jgi:hypothetical protein
MQWREAECMALRPYSFSRLKQLPELRQIISHAAVPAIHSCAGELRQLAAAAHTQYEAERDIDALAEAELARRRLGPDAERALPPNILERVGAIEARRAKAAEAAAASAASGTAAAAGENELFNQEVKEVLQGEFLDDDELSVLQLLAPGLRLCLAAEVAVGMLCSG